ncbi:MAG: hypothetical protein Q4G60_13745 [bacterium]|nr:hypothetical protein [bacterium]
MRQIRKALLLGMIFTGALVNTGFCSHMYQPLPQQPDGYTEYRETYVISEDGSFSTIYRDQVMSSVPSATLWTYDQYEQYEKTTNAHFKKYGVMYEPEGLYEKNKNSKVVLIGDSRTYTMRQAVGKGKCSWITKPGTSYDWFGDIALPMINFEYNDIKNKKIVILLGINDLNADGAEETADRYVRFCNLAAQQWIAEGSQIYVASINPSLYPNAEKNNEIMQANALIQAGLNSNINYIDTYSMLVEDGYVLPDCLHFDAETDQKIYKFIMDAVNQK